MKKCESENLRIWLLIYDSQVKCSHLLRRMLIGIFTPVLADGFSLEFKWVQVSSSLQDSSKYSGRS